MTCAGCGQEMETSAQFCSGCGRPLLRYVSPPVVDRMIRPREGRMIAGVCAGFALRFGWDVAMVRLVTVLAVVFTGVPLVAYVIAWIVMPNGQYALPAQVGFQPGVPAGTQGVVQPSVPTGVPPGGGPGSMGL